MNSFSIRYTKYTIIQITIRHITRNFYQEMLSGADIFCSFTRVFSKTSVITRINNLIYLNIT